MRNYLYIALAVLLFGLGAYVDRLYMRGVVQQETNKLDKTIKERDADLRLAEKRSDNLTLHYQELLNESSKLAKAEAAKAKADLLVSINVANGLRRDITALNAIVTEASRTAVEEYALVSGELLAACAERLVWFSDQADGHRIDANELSNAWPKNQD